MVVVVVIAVVNLIVVVNVHDVVVFKEAES